MITVLTQTLRQSCTTGCNNGGQWLCCPSTKVPRISTRPGNRWKIQLRSI